MGETPRGSFDLLLERIDTISPPLLRIIAPAGYGKTYFCGWLLAHAGHGIRVDVAEVNSVADFMRTLGDAFAQVLGSFDKLERLRNELGRETLDAVDWIRRLSRTLSSGGRRGAIILDNAQALSKQPELLAHVNALLPDKPARHMLVVVSRVPLAMRLSRSLAPHEILTFTARDLRVPQERVRAELLALGASELLVRSAVDLSRGWPIAVELFKRFAREGRIEAVLENRLPCAYDDLHDYVHQEVVSTLDEAARDVLTACAVIPSATLDDLTLALPTMDIKAEAEKLAQPISDLMRIEDGRYTAHPLVAAALRSRAEIAQNILRKTAAGHVASGNMLRAAELHKAAGDGDEVLRTLKQLAAEDTCIETQRLARLVEELEPLEICEHEALWQRHLQTLAGGLAGGFDRWQGAVGSAQTRNEPPVLGRFYLTLAFLAAKFCRLDDAQAYAAKAERYWNGARNQPVAWVTRSLLSSKLASAQSANHVRKEKNSGEPAANVFACEAYAADLWSALFDGTWIARTGELFASLRDILRTYPASPGARLCARQFYWIAWLFGQDDLCRETTQLVDALTTASYDAASPEQEAPAAIVFDRIIAASQAGGENDGLDLLENGRTMLRRLQWPFGLLVWLLGRLQWDKTHKRLISSEIERRAQAIGNPVLKAVVSRAKDEAIKGRFRLRGVFARALLTEGQGAPLTISVYSRRVSIGDEVLKLPDLPFTLLTFLAIRGGEVTREELCESLWEGLTPSSQLNALKSCVHRTRVQFGNRDFLQTTKAGYRLENAVLDIVEAQQKGRRILAKDGLSEEDADELREAVQTLAQEVPTCLKRYDWFTAVDLRARGILESCALALGKHAIESGDFAEAADLAQVLLLLDPCSEVAYTLIIRFHLAKGDRLSAERVMSRYRAILKRELDAEPSREFVAMLEGEPGQRHLA